MRTDRERAGLERRHAVRVDGPGADEGGVVEEAHVPVGTPPPDPEVSVALKVTAWPTEEEPSLDE